MDDPIKLSDPRYPDWGPVEFDDSDEYWDAVEEAEEGQEDE